MIIIVIELMQIIGILIFVYMLIWYAVSIIIKDASIVDIAWGLGFIVIGWLSSFITKITTPVLIINILITIWGLRLAWHIIKRKLKNPGEDFRYAAWRQHWGNTFYWRSFVQVFMLQGVIMFIIALPIIAAANAQVTTINIVTIIGILTWAFGFICEVIADHQLTVFKNDSSNKGKIIQTGIWKYSRHPNYFGESVIWWGIWLISYSITGNWWTIISPILLTYFLLFVSGVPMLEKKYKNNQVYQEYKKRTNVFIPWFSKSS